MKKIYLYIAVMALLATAACGNKQTGKEDAPTTDSLKTDTLADETASTYFSAIERNFGAVILPSAIIAYRPEGLEADKVLLNWTSDDVLMAYMEPRQGPPPEIF